METWQAVNSVRVVREFADRPLEPEHLERILNAARRTASSKNQQEWAFIVMRDRDHLREVPALVESRTAAHRRGSIEQAERGVVANGPFIGDRANLAVLRRRKRFEPRCGFGDELREGPGFAHVLYVTLSYNSVK